MEPTLFTGALEKEALPCAKNNQPLLPSLHKPPQPGFSQLKSCVSNVPHSTLLPTPLRNGTLPNLSQEKRINPALQLCGMVSQSEGSMGAPILSSNCKSTDQNDTSIKGIKGAVEGSRKRARVSQAGAGKCSGGMSTVKGDGSGKSESKSKRKSSSTTKKRDKVTTQDFLVTPGSSDPIFGTSCILDIYGLKTKPANPNRFIADVSLSDLLIGQVKVLPYAHKAMESRGCGKKESIVSQINRILQNLPKWLNNKNDSPYNTTVKPLYSSFYAAEQGSLLASNSNPVFDDENVMESGSLSILEKTAKVNNSTLQPELETKVADSCSSSIIGIGIDDHMPPLDVAEGFCVEKLPLHSYEHCMKSLNLPSSDPLELDSIAALITVEKPNVWHINNSNLVHDKRSNGISPYSFSLPLGIAPVQTKISAKGGGKGGGGQEDAKYHTRDTSDKQVCHPISQRKHEEDRVGMKVVEEDAHLYCFEDIGRFDLGSKEEEENACLKDKGDRMLQMPEQDNSGLGCHDRNPSNEAIQPSFINRSCQEEESPVVNPCKLSTEKNHQQARGDPGKKTTGVNAVLPAGIDRTKKSTLAELKLKLQCDKCFSQLSTKLPDEPLSPSFLSAAGIMYHISNCVLPGELKIIQKKPRKRSFPAYYSDAPFEENPKTVKLGNLNTTMSVNPRWPKKDISNGQARTEKHYAARNKGQVSNTSPRISNLLSPMVSNGVIKGNATSCMVGGHGTTIRSLRSVRGGSIVKERGKETTPSSYRNCSSKGIASCSPNVEKLTNSPSIEPGKIVAGVGSRLESSVQTKNALSDSKYKLKYDTPGGR